MVERLAAGRGEVTEDFPFLLFFFLFFTLVDGLSIPFRSLTLCEGAENLGVK